MKTILITGATGFLGRHLVERLRREEPAARLRLLCRSQSPWDGRPGIDTMPGDVLSPEDVERAVDGADEIYHLAGVVQREPRNVWGQYRVHVDGNRHVCEAMKKHPVERAVFVSSSGTVAVSDKPVERNEDAGYTHEFVGEWPYYLSKIFAEKLAFRYVEQDKLPIVVVNPSLLLGPGDERRSSTHDVELFLRGQILAIPAGGLNLVDARDAAAGAHLAMQHGRTGERYLLGGVNWTFREWIQRVSQLSGKQGPKFSPPLPLALAGARALRGTMRLFGGSFDLDDASIKMSSMFWYCDSRKARSELGFTTRDPMETLRDTIQDVRQRMNRKDPPSPAPDSSQWIVEKKRLPS